MPETGAAHRLGDEVGRVGLAEQEARVVLGNEDRPDTPQQPTRAGQLGSGELRPSGVLPRGVVVALCDVELDEVLSHASTVGPGGGSPKLRRTPGSPVARPQDDPRTTPGHDPRRVLLQAVERGRELDPGADAELGIGVAQVELDGVHRDDQHACDLLVGQTVDGQLGHPSLGRREAAG